VAGKGDGFDDERHLWPAFDWLIEQRRPLVVFGEQVASKDGYAWLDLVQADLEGTGYTVGAVVAPAAGFGAPRQRHRMYWVADTGGSGLEKRISDGRVQRSQVGTPQGETVECGSNAGGLADAGNERCNGQHALLREGQVSDPEATGNSATRGFWSAADWIWCRDEKYRPVEPGTFPLAHGATARVGRLRAYGNAICAPQAEEFIKAYLGVRP
jgi:DNA (cytosine-5)-methyltransferase 1